MWELPQREPCCPPIGMVKDKELVCIRESIFLRPKTMAFFVHYTRYSAIHTPVTTASEPSQPDVKLVLYLKKILIRVLSFVSSMFSYLNIWLTPVTARKFPISQAKPDPAPFWHLKVRQVWRGHSYILSTGCIQKFASNIQCSSLEDFLVSATGLWPAIPLHSLDG